MANIITITAEGEDLVIRDSVTQKSARMFWPKLSNTAPGLKYRSECIAVLLRSVGAKPDCEVDVSDEAEQLLTQATEAARRLY